MNKKWGLAEDKYIRLNAATMIDEDIATKLSELLGRTFTKQSVRKRRQKLGIKKLSGRGKCGIIGQDKIIII